MGFEILNFLLTISHVIIILIICFGWIWRKSHVIYLVCNLCALFSWYILGYFKGYGYCLLTDIQWRLLESRGITDLPDTFLEYFFSALSLNSFFSGNYGIVDFFKYFIFITFILRMSYIFFMKKRLQKQTI